MSKPQEKQQLWVRFPENEAKLCIMTLDGRAGLLLMHKADERGDAVRRGAKAMGFRTVKMKSGAIASVFMRTESGYPFGIRALAQGLGGVAMNIPLSVLHAESFPRQAPKAQTKTERTVESAPVRSAPSQAQTPAPKEDEEPKKPVADPTVGDEIAKLMSGLDLKPDAPETPDADDDQPDLF